MQVNITILNNEEYKLITFKYHHKLFIDRLCVCYWEIFSIFIYVNRSFSNLLRHFLSSVLKNLALLLADSCFDF